MNASPVASLILLASLAAMLIAGCQSEPPPDPQIPSNESREEKRPVFHFETDTDFEKAKSPATQTGALQPLRLTDVAAETGLDFTYENGAYGQALMVESLGGGCCWLDFDRDGWPDLFLTQGGKPDAADPSERPTDRLFHNRRGIRFVPVAHAGVEGKGYGQGAAAADFDGDGFDDLYVTNVGRNVLYQNLGDGTFADVTESAGVGDPRWSSSAAWSDLNGDGHLDLYVCNYGDYDPYSPRECLKDGVPALCHPREIPPVPDECYINLGDGRFEAAATRLGLYGEGNRGLGVVAADLNNNGLTDLYVCNDTTANFLFLAQPDGTYQEAALLCGAALNAQGYAQASMGVAVGDYDGNGALDLYLTHFTNEENAVYQNQDDPGSFREVAGLSGMRPISYSKLGFGTVMYDLNGDGAMDLFVANGHIDPRNADGDGYEQFPQIISFLGNRWVEVSEQGGEYFQRKLVGRGVAAADFDRDGDLDLAVVHQNSPMALLRNDFPEARRTVSFRFRGSVSPRNGINVRVWMRCGEQSTMQELAGGTSYCVSHYPELIFPCDGSESCSVRVRWPSGREFEYNDLATHLPVIFFEDGKFLQEEHPPR
ncbi:MAG TPA: CRTAC1 family protein [Planctomycetaceae bacterium]|nr:CRTAC1 family protein [Planctomycetaceae bacterium]